MERHVALSTEADLGTISDFTRESEKLGFDGLWLTDLRFSLDCFTVLGALAVLTDRIQLFTGVCDPFSRHPAQLAAAIGTLQKMSHGRAALGLGAGGSNLDKIGIARVKPLSTVEAAITAIRALLAGELTNAETESFQILGGKMPPALCASVPIALVAHGPKMYQLAGRLADMAVIANVIAPEAISWAREQLDAGANMRSTFLPPLRVVWRTDVCISPVPNRAREFMRARTRAKLQRGNLSPDFLQSVGMRHLVPLTRWSDNDVDQLMDTMGFAGTPDEVAPRLREAAKTAKADIVCCRIDPAPGEALLDGLANLAEVF